MHPLNTFNNIAWRYSLTIVLLALEPSSSPPLTLPTCCPTPTRQWTLSTTSVSTVPQLYMFKHSTYPRSLQSVPFDRMKPAQSSGVQAG